MQQARRSLGYVFLIIAILITPTAGMLGWFQYTHNPNLRPLGITREALREFGVPGTGVEVVVYIDSPTAGAGQPARQRLASDIRASFASKGVDVRLVFRETGGSTLVTYVIGNSVLGPYPRTRASEGISAAVEAYRMY